VGIAGDRDVCRNRINRVVPVRITTDFHASKDISSDLVVSNDVVDITDKYNWMDINLMTSTQLTDYIMFENEL
jgi:hypothetical protein